MTDKYAVIGNPIAHSKSPLIHQMFAQQTGQDMSYEAILAPLDGFAATITRLRKENYKGCNVTVPFKFEAFQILHGFTRNVLDAVGSGNKADAVNTLDFRNEEIAGENTDGTGLVNDIEKNLKIPLRDKHILLIGTGGAAYGVLHPLLEASQAPLVICSRTLEKAVSLKKSIEQHESFQTFFIKAADFDTLGDAQFDVIINATSAGLTDSEIPLPENIFAPGALAYDMMYGRETPFMKFAHKHGTAIVSDGLGMLVEQAAEAFFIWRGVRPDTRPVLEKLRAA